jgi:RLL motif containing protein 1
MSYSKLDAALRRWLSGLGCPFAYDVYTSRPIELQRTVCWLEDSIIRLRRPADRIPLRSRNFSSAFTAYLDELGAPTTVLLGDSVVAAVRWLTRFALRQALDDDKDRINDPIDPWSGLRVPIVPGAAGDERLAEVMTRMVQSLELGDVPIPSVHIGLRAIATHVEAVMASRNSDLLTANPEIASTEVPGDSVAGDTEERVLRSAPVAKQTVVLDELPLGFSTGDNNLDRVARVMRLLYAREMRLLQDRINKSISSLQQITGDPKTDSRLGQVGR